MKNTAKPESATLPLQDVQIQDTFWSSYMDLVHQVVIPYQWDALNDRIPDAEPSYAIHNFRIAAGVEQGSYGGLVFQDSDLAKWLEAVAYRLATHPDPALEEIADETIQFIIQAQQKDGYINTYFTVKEPDKRWTNLHDCHELYCAGHMMEAAVAYYEATGKRAFLHAMCRFADYIDTVFGPDEGKIHGYDGHQEIELALVKLYRVTGEQRYLRLSQYFIDARGQQPNFFIEEWEQRGRTSHWVPGEFKPDPQYNQSHLPVREQSTAVGHAVRAVYMYSAMADLARLTGDQALAEACRRLWNNVTKRQMYITGGIGSTRIGEAFSLDWNLPNERVYGETCASIGLIFFAHRMLQLEQKAEYADVLERALYNNVIGSMSEDGKHYFYVNPLEVWPDACAKDPELPHVKPVRQKWFGCSCCPPNVARILASLGTYIYTVNNDTIYTHLFVGNKAKVHMNGLDVLLKQETDSPWNGNIRITVTPERAAAFRLALRVPGWCKEQPTLRINGQAHTTLQVVDGYCLIDRPWQPGDVVEWVLAMEVQFIAAHPFMRANAGKVAIQRGPFVYALEEVDHAAPLASLSINPTQLLTARRDASLPGEPIVLEGILHQEASAHALSEDEPYHVFGTTSAPTLMPLRAVPYFMWGNRNPGEMAVWIRTNHNDY
ncbi:hypothetical protein BVG16_10295 [Paenibacillus selenitireducens]|uniref:Glycoside hydrolase family 127 protein n=1 Tax=Paenibacillus selenitireducens TaxID=1324314 RepID=A0A1T2XI26_9BACL|nr:beta-L-arabinofuranosidase domain-containing protein [Paenibacillus selenitireducens]OPA79452.1 hypothetical protein BVG16_10295 [Paenibacillus selenitireducens]